MTVRLIVALVLAGVVLAGGCRRAAKSMSERMMERAIERESGGKAHVDISRDGNKVTFKTDKGEVVTAGGEGVAVPADFPKDVPVYKGAKVLAVVNSPDASSLSLEVNDSMQAISQKFASEMKAQGWEDASSMSTGDGMVLTYKKEQRTASIAIAKSGDISHVTIIVQKKSE